MKILSIDAWGNNEGGYEWNNWFKVGTISKEDFEKLDSNRKLIKYMRDEGFLSDCSKGKISIEDDQYNIVFCNKNNKRPIFAIEYGPEY